jgi:hypothetical protein
LTFNRFFNRFVGEEKKMKKLLFVLAVIVIAPCIYGEEITAKSRINAVEVFSDRAIVERSASLEVAQGSHMIIFEGLPPSIMENTIRVAGKGTASCEIMGTEIEDRDVVIPGLKELEQQLEAIDVEIEKTDGSLSLLDQQEELLKSIMANSTAKTGKEISEGKPDLITMDKLFGFLSSKYDDINTRRLTLNLKTQELEKRRFELEKQRNELLSNKAKKDKKATILVRCDKPGNLALSLYYTVKGCSWSPAYIAKALPESSKIEITTMASIIQKTYEDWNGVAVTLSTSAPSLGISPPDLNPSFIDCYLPQQGKALSREVGEVSELKAQPGGAGSIVGKVNDPDGEPIPGAVVVVRSVLLKGSRGTQTDVDGKFQFPLLPPADDYKIRVEAPGFGAVIQSGLAVKIGTTTNTILTLSAAGEEMVVCGRAPEEDEPVIIADYSNADLSEAGFHVNFSINGRIDVPTDGKDHRFFINRDNVDAKYDYYSVPRKDDKAFMRASFTNSMDFPILPGEVEFFYAGGLVGSANMPSVARGAEAKAYFGRNSEVGLIFEELKRDKLEQGFLGNKERLKIQNRISIENHTKNEIKIEVLDKLPKPRMAEIQLVDVRIVPEKNSEKPNNLFIWNLTLKPQEKKEILIDFTIEYPKGMILRGM